MDWEEEEIYLINFYIVCFKCRNVWVVGHMEWISLLCQFEGCDNWIKNNFFNRMVWKWLVTKNLI